VATAIVDQDNLHVELFAERRSHADKALHEVANKPCFVIDRGDDREAGTFAAAGRHQLHWTFTHSLSLQTSLPLENHVPQAFGDLTEASHSADIDAATVRELIKQEGVFVCDAGPTSSSRRGHRLAIGDCRRSRILVPLA